MTEDFICTPFTLAICSDCVFKQLIGTGTHHNKVLTKAGKILNTNESILIKGQPGSGKELLARTIHYAKCSNRCETPFISINCKNIETLGVVSDQIRFNKENDLSFFNHENRVFDNFGTLFLKEIGHLDASSQEILLKYIKDSKTSREKKYPVMDRIISTTSMNIRRMVREGNFNKELFEELANTSIKIKPLEERQEDILPLILHFLRKFATARGVDGYFIPERTLKKYLEYNWSGNIEELSDFIYTSIAELPKNASEIKNYPLKHHRNASQAPLEKENLRPLWEIEKDYIIKTLKACNGNQVSASKFLKIARNTLIRKIKEYDIKVKKMKKSKYPYKRLVR